jgi:oligopeptide transport system substrate-binding protein
VAGGASLLLSAIDNLALPEQRWPEVFRIITLVCAGVVVVELCTLGLTRAAGRADFTYVNPSGIHTLDPARMSWTQDFRVALNLWEGLTIGHPQTTEPVGGAALFPPEISEDRRTYRFTVLEDRRWSNGDAVVAEDFVRGWRRALEPGTAADYAFLFTDHIEGAEAYVRWRQECVGALGAGAPSGSLFDRWAAELEPRFAAVGIRAEDERTLVVQLRAPCPYFLDLTALAPFLPCHSSIELLRESHRGAAINAQGLVVYDPQWTKPDYHRNGYPGLVTNGAYRLEEWIFKQRARLAPNPHYRDAARLACRTIDMLEYDNVGASLLAYEAGKVDLLTDLGVPYDHEIARLARSGERRDFHLCTLLATYFLNFNCVAPSVAGWPNPFLDRRVRKAFSLSIDREQLVEKVRKRGDRVAHSFVPPDSIPGYAPPAGLACDREEARRLLAEAGFPGGIGLPPVELLYVPNDARMCQAMARMWEETLNVRIELRSQESKTFAEEKAKHRYMLARGNWYADYSDPTTFLNCLATGNGNNDSGYSNLKYDALLGAANEAPKESRMALLRQAEAIVVEDDCPILPILHYTETIAIQPHVRGLHPNARLWFPFRFASVVR